MIHAAQRALLACAVFAALTTCSAVAQTSALSPPNADMQTSGTRGYNDATANDAAALDEVRRQLQQQQAEIERLRAALTEQSRLLNELLARSSRPAETVSPAAALREDVATANDVPSTTTRRGEGATHAAKNPQTEQMETRVGRIESQAQKTTETIARQLGSITFSGDLRMRYEGIFGQLNALPNAGNPALVGNELSARHRARLRARLALRGQIGKQFDWGLRLATGTPSDVTSSNQTLTDFFAHKQFDLNQAYLTYRPAMIPGLRLQGGKFETPWLFTEMTLDADIQPEGINESYSRDFKHPTLKNLSLVAWQLPMLERQAAFVLGSDGRVNVEASRRGGRDLALYGAQAYTRLAFGAKSSLTLSAANLYFSGTQFIRPAQISGSQLQVPVTLTIPANGTTPAQTVNGFAAIPREFFVSGSGLGVSGGNTNAVNRDGRLASGFNLVDLIARLEVTHNARFPVTLLFNFVANTQARDVVLAGANGANRFLPNRENHGYWAEIQAGRAREAGDLLFNYTFTRIERDAVLTPFNYSDMVQPSDVRAHRVLFTYTANPRVLLSFTGLFSSRLNGLLGAFGTTPPGSLNRSTRRLQFDTVFRF